MRASTTLLSVYEGTVIREYTGYDENPSIVEKVDSVCSRDQKQFGDKTHKCAVTKLFFTGPIENCDGHIDVLDNDVGITFTVY